MPGTPHIEITEIEARIGIALIDLHAAWRLWAGHVGRVGVGGLHPDRTGRTGLTDPNLELAPAFWQLTGPATFITTASADRRKEKEYGAACPTCPRGDLNPHAR